MDEECNLIRMNEMGILTIVRERTSGEEYRDVAIS